MRIVAINEFRVEVTLTPEDLNDFDITYERMDYADADTRRVLWTLLAEVRRMNGVSLDLSGRLLIEVNREADGCCRVCFTSLPQKDGRNAAVRQLVKSETAPVVLECGDLDSVVRAAAAQKTDTPAALYRLGNRYRLVLSVNSDEREAAVLRACDFGELPPEPSLCAAECAELWQCLVPENAAALLRKLR